MPRLSILTAGLAWSGLVVTSASLVLRFVPPIHPVGLLVAALLPFLAIGAVVAFSFGVATARRRLAAASALLVLATTLVIWPFDAVTDCRPFDERSAGSLVIYQANVLKEEGGGIPARYRADIGLADPDVLLLQEVTPAFVAELDDGSLEHLTHRSIRNGIMVWSRMPFVEVPTSVSSGTLAVVIDDGLGPIEIINVHMAAPASGQTFSRWEEQFDELADSAVSDGEARIIGGDFNATDAHRPFRSLLDRGLTDVHDVAGCGMGATWPVRTLGPVAPPPILRLDHVLFSEHFDVMGLRVGPAIDQPLGSDHHPVVVELDRS